MADVRAKYVPPAIDQVSFNCPHCGALAKQSWFSAHAEALGKDEVPNLLDPKQVEAADFNRIDDVDERRKTMRWAERMAKGRPFLNGSGKYRAFDLRNVSLSLCFSCNDVAIWIYSRLVWPQLGAAPLANPDLPGDVRNDYEEASTILDLSPRGAAALLRLGIQKLCKQLGEKGKNIDEDIASLVKKGLDVRVQQALDVVRVIGNNAIHPGEINLKDDCATAEKLFGLVNLIAEIMISQPKHVEEMFGGFRRGLAKP
ncbi:MAG: DUF4145 domain-containing protein [Kiloniellales bacterium]